MKCNRSGSSAAARIHSSGRGLLRIYARKTVKGTADKPRTQGGSTADKPAPPKATATASSSSKPSKSPSSKPGGKPKRSAFNEFMRNTPVLNRFADGTLLLGDLVMIAATEVSSERIPYESMPMLTGVSLLSWVVAAAALGDYKGDPPTSDDWVLSMLGPGFLALVDSTLTWGLSVVLSLAVFSALVSSGILDSGPMLDDLATDNLSPQLEVATAALITMGCWRGIAARLRYN